MGNVKSFCCKDTISEADDREERSRILDDNCDDLYNNNSLAPANSQQDTISYGSISNGNKTMEQSALDKIYQKMAANVIDVAPGESMVIQQAEFVERQKAYQAKLNQIKTPLPLKITNRVSKQANNSSLFDIGLNNSSPSSTANSSSILVVSHNTTLNTNNQSNNQPTFGNNTGSINSTQSVNKAQEKRRVEYEPIPVDDLQLINEISLKTVQAIANLKITSSEQVVAQFKL